MIFNPSYGALWLARRLLDFRHLAAKLPEIPSRCLKIWPSGWRTGLGRRGLTRVPEGTSPRGVSQETTNLLGSELG